MCHFIFLPLLYSTHPIIIISIVLFCDNYHLCFQFVNGADGIVFLTNYTEKITSKLKPNDEIIILGVLLQPIFFIDLNINTDNIPFHLKSTDDSVIFNTLKKGHWLNEIKLKPNPLTVNTSFIIHILLDAHGGFNISFNEQMLFKIEKRDPLDNVNQLRIYGNFTLKTVRIIPFSKEEDNSMKKALIIGIAITVALIVITGMGVFYITKRHRVHSNSKHRPNNDQDSIVESLGSYRSKRTAKSNVTYLTGNSFLS